MKFTNSSSNLARAFRYSAGMSLLSVILVACSSDGGDPTPAGPTTLETGGLTTGLTTTGLTTDGSTSGLTTTGLTTDGSTSGLTTTGLTTDGSTSGLTTTGLTTDGSTSGLTTTGLTTDGSTSGLTTTGLTTEGSTSGLTTTGFTTEGSTSGLTTSGLTTSGEPGGTNTATQMSCAGTRMWGPLLDEGRTLYISEANGRTESEVPGCRLIWDYDTSQNCSVGFLLNTESITEVTATGQLSLQENAATTPIQLPAADISVDALEDLPVCPSTDTTGGESTGGESTGGESTGGESTGGESTGGDIIIGGEGELTPLSCDGRRVWGPIEEGGSSIYLSEAGGNGTLRDCAIFWDYRTAQNCTAASNIADDATARVNDEGSLEFRFGSSLVEIGLAGISFEDLSQIPSCP